MLSTRAVHAMLEGSTDELDELTRRKLRLEKLRADAAPGLFAEVGTPPELLVTRAVAHVIRPSHEVCVWGGWGGWGQRCRHAFRRGAHFTGADHDSRGALGLIRRPDTPSDMAAPGDDTELPSRLTMSDARCGQVQHERRCRARERRLALLADAEAVR